MSRNQRAVFWSGLEKVGSYAANFIIQIVLARMLCPDDYAVVAMLAIFMSVAQVFVDGGFATVLIQKKDCSQNDYSTVFYFNILVSIFLYLVLFISAPNIENFYKFNGLAKVMRFYSLTLIINSFAMVNRLLLIKHLKFNVIAAINICATIISAIPTIYLAYKGASYWALVFQSILNSLLITVGVWGYTKWLPDFNLSFLTLKKLLPFGIRIFVVDVFYALYNNIYSLLIGKKFPAEDLGFYDRSKYVGSMGPIGFSDFFLRAMYPIQAQLQDDSFKLSKSYMNSFELICLIIVPLSMFMSMFSYEVLGALYGDQWVEAQAITSILSIGFMFYPLHALNVNMLKVRAIGDVLLKSEILKKVICLCVLFCLIRYNILVVVIGWTICAIMDFIISEYYYCKSYQANPKPSMCILAKIALVSGAILLGIKSILCMFSINMFVTLVSALVLYFSIYLMLWGKRIKRIISELE